MDTDWRESGLNYRVTDSLQPVQEKCKVKNSLVLKNVVLSLLPVLVSSNDFLFLQNCFYRD